MDILLNSFFKIQLNKIINKLINQFKLKNILINVNVF